MALHLMSFDVRGLYWMPTMSGIILIQDNQLPLSATARIIFPLEGALPESIFAAHFCHSDSLKNAVQNMLLMSPDELVFRMGWVRLLFYVRMLTKGI